MRQLSPKQANIRRIIPPDRNEYFDAAVTFDVKHFAAKYFDEGNNVLYEDFRCPTPHWHR